MHTRTRTHSHTPTTLPLTLRHSTPTSARTYTYAHTNTCTQNTPMFPHPHSHYDTTQTHARTRTPTPTYTCVHTRTHTHTTHTHLRQHTTVKKGNPWILPCVVLRVFTKHKYNQNIITQNETEYKNDPPQQTHKNPFMYYPARVLKRSLFAFCLIVSWWYLYCAYDMFQHVLSLCYGVATISRLLKVIVLFCRISSLL